MRIMATAILVLWFLLAPALGSDVAPQTFRIGIDASYPPFSELDEAGRPKGFDVDIARALCAGMKVSCTLVQQDWEGLIPALLAKKFDAIVASMSITEKRRQWVAFTDKYYSGLVRFVARKDSGFDPAAPAGRTIGAARATIASDWLEANVSGVAAIKLFTAPDGMFQGLVSGEVDALLGDALGFWQWLQTPEGSGFTFVGDGLQLDEGIGIAVRKEDDALRRDLNRALKAILADGTYKKINARYFPFSIY